MTRTAHSLRLGLALAAAGALTACATLSVNSYVERGLDFSRYRSYALESPADFATGDPRLDNNVVFRDHLQGAIARELKGRGFMSTDGKPDLLVHYHASIRQQVDMNGADQKKGYEVGYDSAAQIGRAHV